MQLIWAFWIKTQIIMEKPQRRRQRQSMISYLILMMIRTTCRRVDLCVGLFEEVIPTEVTEVTLQVSLQVPVPRQIVVWIPCTRALRAPYLSPPQRCTQG